ncbi:hypothetical protein [Hydrogenophaga palleronii]|uniref:hypothetical protein n=1 Tax=Hydrogenophaga palleronii TaxID=65655 RepID=UPI0008243358|nr:hypothetical protein [Hydrogenophaga palleronii]
MTHSTPRTPLPTLSRLLRSLGAAALVFGTVASLAAEPPQAPSGNLRLFVSGHSLTDNPVGEYITQIASSMGTPARYNQQIVIGSPIRARTHGQGSWSGYRQGKNRSGSDIDVLGELRSGKEIGGDRYNVLLITERHDLLGPLIWEDTVRQLRHFHERAHDANPAVQTYLYTSWWGIKDMANPQTWVQYEREADQAWQCIATRINTSLIHENRPDRIRQIPAAAALAALVDRSTRQQLPGFSQADVKATMGQLFTDDVHLTRAGAYYVALVSYATIYGRSPVGAWSPSGVGAAQAKALQSVAWDFLSPSTPPAKPLTLAQCNSYMVKTFCEASGNFVSKGDAGTINGCKQRFSQSGPDNPLSFDAQRDAAHWHPAP